MGAFILRDLLLHTDSDVHALVRPPPLKLSPNENEKLTVVDSCTLKLVENLEKYGIISETEQGRDLRQLFMDRVTVVPGDVSEDNFGINSNTENNYNTLTSICDTVIHAAATVNLLYPYETMVAPNVKGTANVVKFAQTNKVKMLHYVSTNGVFPEQLPRRHFNENCNMTQVVNELNSGYAQSKWVAEQIVFKARDAGLPTTIYRCGNLGGPVYEIRGPYCNGCWNTSDSNLHFLEACFRIGAVPLGSGTMYHNSFPEAKFHEMAIELTPVDFTSGLIVNATRDIKFVNNRLFHLIAPTSMKMKSVLGCCRSAGYNLKIVSDEEWLSLHETDIATNAENVEKKQIQQFSAEALEGLFRALHNFERTSVDELLTMTDYFPHEYPQLTELQMTNYIFHLGREGKISKPKKKGL